jgi:DNA-directed RNA polymerase subunit M/transcription elongation factor TFIIS
VVRGDKKRRLKMLSVHGFKKKIGGEKGLPKIKCSSCGAEIMLVPNVKLMSEVIEAHVEKHKHKIKDPNAAEAEAESIRDDLITQILEKASNS